jgi:hypothetical protein
VQAGEYCKTVGSAYVGSNPTPATTCENGLLAAETRPGGPFPSRHAVYQGASLRVDARQWLRTYSGQRPGGTSGSYNRSLRRSAGPDWRGEHVSGVPEPGRIGPRGRDRRGDDRCCRRQLVHCGVAGMTKSTTPCVFCGRAGSLSDEHVVPKWLRKALQIREQSGSSAGPPTSGPRRRSRSSSTSCASAATQGGWRGWKRTRARSSGHCSWGLAGYVACAGFRSAPCSGCTGITSHACRPPRHPGVDGRLQHFRPSRVDPGRVPV